VRIVVAHEFLLPQLSRQQGCGCDSLSIIVMPQLAFVPTVTPPQLSAAGQTGLKYWLVHRRSELRTSCNLRSWIPTFRAAAEWWNSALIATFIDVFHAC
jgi:hypothetical protein